MRYNEDGLVKNSEARILEVKKRIRIYDGIERALNHGEAESHKADPAGERANVCFMDFSCFDGGLFMKKEDGLENIAADIEVENAELIKKVAAFKNGGWIEKALLMMNMREKALQAKSRDLKEARIAERLLSILSKLEKLLAAVMADAANIKSYFTAMAARREALSYKIKEATENRDFFSGLRKTRSMAAGCVLPQAAQGIFACAEAEKMVMADKSREAYTFMIDDWNGILKILNAHMSAYEIFLARLAEIKKRIDSAVMKFKNLFTAAAAFVDEFEKKLDKRDYAVLMAESLRASAMLELNEH